MKYYCCDQYRMEVVKQYGINGLEYLEVYDSGKPNDDTRQLTLFVKFLQRVPDEIQKNNFRIEGGERIKTVDIEWVAPATSTLPTGEPDDLLDEIAPQERFLLIRTKSRGDFSTYTLKLINADASDALLQNFDPRLREIQFSFKVQCPSDFDCLTSIPCRAPTSKNPHLDYLAKDYASFRRLMLDRMSTLVPEWRNRNAADVGVTLVELLAYVGDQLSYQQDAVATEAYLGTARLRTSLRRHARLVDYIVHDGCNARVWVQIKPAGIKTNDDGNDVAVALPRHTPLLTRVPGIPPRIAPNSDELNNAMASGTLVFETAEDAVLYPSHNTFHFYTWGDKQCCLPKGATSATLVGKFSKLKAGDVLVFAEVLEPRTGNAEDADRSHRWAVRLVDVRLALDPSGGLFLPGASNKPVDITEIRWAEQDALPLPLCISTITDPDSSNFTTYLDNVTIAYGNIVLADHGLTITGEEFTYKGAGVVPDPHLTAAAKSNVARCERPPLLPVPPRFRPRLARRPLTNALPLIANPLFRFTPSDTLCTELNNRRLPGELQDVLQVHGVVIPSELVVQGGDGMWSLSDGIHAYRLQHDGIGNEIVVSPLSNPASLIAAADPKSALPAITLESIYESKSDPWTPRSDLLASDGDANEFVVECEHDGSAYLRFGDDEHGKRPHSGTAFKATYRIGNGTAGNIGMESIAHIVNDDEKLLSVSNPLPAKGGADPETSEDIKRDAPEAFRVQERAVTPEDYAEVTERDPGIQRAAATFRWTGSWHTAFLTVDRMGGADVDEAYEQAVRNHIERYRMAGYDLEVDGPRYVPLRLEMNICVKPDYFRGDVCTALMRVFSNGWLPDGKRALFHPDNFTFGQPVYLSKLYEVAQDVEGVASVVINVFQRLREPPDTKPLEGGVLTFGRLEIARLDNDPNFPERGVLKLSVGGGK